MKFFDPKAIPFEDYGKEINFLAGRLKNFLVKTDGALKKEFLNSLKNRKFDTSEIDGILKNFKGALSEQEFKELQKISYDLSKTASGEIGLLKIFCEDRNINLGHLYSPSEGLGEIRNRTIEALDELL